MASLKDFNRFFLTPLLIALALMAAFSSCSARIDGVVRDGGAAELELRTALDPVAAALIRRVSSFLGTDDAPVLDGPAIGRSMASAPGVRNVSFINISPSALEGVISLSSAGEFLASGNVRFIEFSEGPESSSIIITLNRESAPELISRLSPEVEEYLSVLMAPAVLGERTTRQEYLDLISMVYGRPMADEIAAGRILVRIEFPRPLTAVKGGIARERHAEFDIPLVDILVLEQPISYEIRW